MKVICVLAGTKAEYEQWLREHGETNRTAIYGHSHESILGHEFSRVVTTGTFGGRSGDAELVRFASAYVR